MNETVRSIVGWVDAFIWTSAFLIAAHALYAWFKQRDKPLAIQSGGSALIVFSTWSPDLIALGVAGLIMAIYGSRLVVRRSYRRMTTEALKKFGGDPPFKSPSITPP